MALLLVASVLADPTVYFQETFEDGGMVMMCLLCINTMCTDAWRGRWVQSKHKSDYGEWKLTAGDFYGDAEKDKGEQRGKCVRLSCLPGTSELSQAHSLHAEATEDWREG